MTYRWNFLCREINLLVIVNRCLQLKRVSCQTAFLVVVAWTSALSQNPVPHLDQPTTPAVVTPGSGAFTMLVNGTGFVPGAVLNWNGVAQATTFVSPAQLSVLVPAANVAVAGTAILTAFNPGSATKSNAIYFPITTPSTSVFYEHATDSPIVLGQVGGLPVEPMSITSGDVNGDGKLDLVFGAESTPGGPELRVLLGKGDGTFQTGPTSNGVGSCPCSLALGDLNGDGKLDIAVANANVNTVSILLGAGNGSFSAAVKSFFNVGNEPTAVVLADFNRDGRLDLAVANSFDETVSTFVGDGDGTFTFGTTFSTPGSPFSIVAGDFNADGKLDIGTSSSNANSVTILLGNGDGTFAAPTTFPATSGFRVVTADFSSDGKLDLAVPSDHDSTVSVLLGNGDGTFATVPSCCGISTNSTLSFDMAVGDFNGDGKLDLASSILDTKPGVPVSYVVMQLGNADGTFATADFTRLLPTEAATMTVGDYNRDGKLDFAVGSNPDGEVSVLVQPPTPGPEPDFAMTSTTGAATVSAGETANFTVQVSSNNGFLGQLSLACSGAPRQATCSLPSNTFLFDSATATFRVIVSTRAGSSAVVAGVSDSPTRGTFGGLLAGVFGPMLTLLVVLPVGRFTRARKVGLACMVLTGALFMANCGGGSSNPPANGTPTGTYTLTVTAHVGSVQKMTSLTLTVQ